MKKLLLLSLYAVIFSACSQVNNKTPWHEVRYSQDGKDSVVYVHSPYNGGSNFLMNYMLFRMLYSNGGYGSVYKQYYANPDAYRGTPQVRSYQSRGSSPSYPGTSIFRSSPSSYSSPSFSTPTRSYSSPSFTPSRSFSSPSFSPSRSFSSPSFRR